MWHARAMDLGRTLMCPVLALAAACGPIVRIPVNLPPRDAPMEVRVAAYRAHAADLQGSLWQGSRVRLGDARETIALRDAREVIENAPEAEAILAARDRRSTFAMGLSSGGAAVVLTCFSLATWGPMAESRDGSFLAVSITGVVGALAMVVGTLIGFSAEADGTRAVGAYNRWLWDALALPRAQDPAVSPAALVPSARTPGVLAPGSAAPTAVPAP
jgi:hypothetical protein